MIHHSDASSQYTSIAFAETLVLEGIAALLGEATGAEAAQVYTSLGLRLNYDPYLRRVKATADLSRFAGCVRGCLRPKGET